MFLFPTLNRSSPQMQGLRYCWPFFGYQGTTAPELVRGAHATVTANPAVAGPQSPLITPAYNGTTHFAVAPLITLGDVNTLTVSLWLYWDVNGSGYDLALEYTVHGDSAANGGGNGFYFIPDWGSPVSWMVGTCGTTSAGTGYLTVRPSAAAWHHFVICMNRTVNYGLVAAYVDGRSVAFSQNGLGTTTGNFKADSPMYFMKRGFDSSLIGAGRLCDVRFYPGKLLSAAEAWALYDPRTRWDLYLPEERQVWSLPIAGAGGVPRQAAYYYRQRRAA